MVFLYSWSSALLLTGLQYNMNLKHEQSTTNCWTIILNILTFWDIFFLFQVINYFIFGNLNHFAGEALTLIISQCLFSALSVETKDNVSLAWSWWWLMGSFAVSAKAKIFCMFCGRLVFICSVSFTFVSVTPGVNRVQCENKDLQRELRGVCISMRFPLLGKKGYKVIR